jgi:hypothetical protein
MYCKVCHDSGKPETVYTSHFIRETRDPNSRIVCPTLLSIECGYCKNKGHTVKYCPKLKNKNNIQNAYVPPEKKQQNIQKVQEKKPPVVKNMYVIFENDDEDEEEGEVSEIEDVETDDDVFDVNVGRLTDENKSSFIMPDLETRIRLGRESTINHYKCRNEVPLSTSCDGRNEVPLRWAEDISDSDDDYDYETEIINYSNVGSYLVAD